MMNAGAPMYRLLAQPSLEITSVRMACSLCWYARYGKMRSSVCIVKKALLVMLTCTIKDRSESIFNPRFPTSIYVVGGASSSLGHMVVGWYLCHCPQVIISVFAVLHFRCFFIIHVFIEWRQLSCEL